MRASTGRIDRRTQGEDDRFIEVSAHHYHDYVGFARWFYRGKHFPLYQIIWPSTDGHFPWSSKASEHFKVWQPILGSAPITD